MSQHSVSNTLCKFYRIVLQSDKSGKKKINNAACIIGHTFWKMALETHINNWEDNFKKYLRIMYFVEVDCI